MKRIIRAISLILSVLILLTMTPLTVFADSTMQNTLYIYSDNLPESATEFAKDQFSHSASEIFIFMDSSSDEVSNLRVALASGFKVQPYDSNVIANNTYYYPVICNDEMVAVVRVTYFDEEYHYQLEIGGLSKSLNELAKKGVNSPLIIVYSENACYALTNNDAVMLQRFIDGDEKEIAAEQASLRDAYNNRSENKQIVKICSDSVYSDTIKPLTVKSPFESFAPFKVTGTLTEFKSIEDLLDYKANKGWVNEPWYSDAYYDQRISYICFMEYFIYVPNEYNKEDIAKIWIDDVKVTVFLKDGSKLSYKFRSSIGADIHLPYEFYYSKGEDDTYKNLSSKETINVMADTEAPSDYSGVYLKFCNIEELLNFIKDEKWNNELWYHPARENNMVNYMKKYLRTHLFIPVEYTKDEIYQIDFSDSHIYIVFKDNKIFSYKYTIFDKAASISAPTFWINATTTSTSGISTSHTTVYNIMSDNSTNKVVKPLERCSLSANNAMILPFICLSAS